MANPSDDEQQAVDEQLHDLIAEYHDRVDQGEVLEPAGFTEEHPELKAELSRYFENVDTLESLAGPTASQIEARTNAIDIDGETHAGEHAETMLESSTSGDVARLGSDAPRTQFGRYRIVEELGRGAMGAVYLAHDEQLDREVALKIPKFDSEMNSGLLERFYREARAAAALQHSGICPVFDVGELDGQHYITMAFIKGRPLRDFTKSSKRQEGKQIARAIRKIAMAMAEAHDHNVVHRDLKPANIMINEKNEPVVMDFGLARRSTEGEERLTHTGTVIGTPAYMSPEQVDGDNDHVGPHSDIYSLGVICYEMLTGRLPFQGNLMSIFKQIATVEPPAPNEIHHDIDPSLQAICLSMMAKKIEDRPASMSEVTRDLTLWLQGRQIAADETEPLESSQVSGPPSAKNNEATAPLNDDPIAATIIRETEPTQDRLQSRAVGRGRPKNQWLLITGSLGGVAVLLAGIMIIVQLGRVKVQITLDDPTYSLKVDGDVLILEDTSDLEGRSKSIRLSANEHKLTVMQGDLIIDNPKSFIVKKDGKNAITVFVDNEKVTISRDGKRVPASPGEVSPASEPTSPPVAKATVLLASPSISPSVDVATGVWSTDWEWTKSKSLGQLGAPYELELASVDGMSTLLFEVGEPGSRNVWRRDRLAGTSTWSKPQKQAPPINTSNHAASPFLSRDGMALIFESDRPGGSGQGDLWISTRDTISAPWSAPTNLGGNVNSAQAEGLATLSADGLQLIFASDRLGSVGSSDLWECTRESIEASWSVARNISSLNTPDRELAPLLSSDGLSLILTSDRPNRMGSADLWLSRRSSLQGSWSRPLNLGEEVNTPGFEYGLILSADSKSLIYNSNRRGKRSTFLSRRVPKVRQDSTHSELHGHAPIVETANVSAPPIDILANVNAAWLDSVNMRWEFNDGILAGSGIAPSQEKKWAGITFPDEITGDYDFELEFKQFGFAPLNVDLPLGEKQAVRVHLGLPGSALTRIDGKAGSDAAEPYRNDGAKMKNNNWQRLTAKIRHLDGDVSIDVALDGIRVGQFAGVRSRVSLPKWVTADPVHLIVAGYADFSAVQLAFRRIVISPSPKN